MPARREIPTRRRSALARSGFPALTALVVAAIIGVLGLLYVRSERRQLRDQVEAQLAAIADQKVSQIVEWRSERLADAEAYSRILSRTVKSILPRRPAAFHGEIGPLLRTIAVSYGYADVILIDPQGTALASAGEAAPPPAADAARQLAAATREGAAIFDVARDGRTQLHVVAAIFDPDRAGALLGGLLLRVEPRSVLFPMLQRWPLPSATAEVALLRVDGSSVVSLNEARYRTGTSTTLSLPLEDTRYPAVRIARGEEGLLRASDYRGVDVLAVGRPVPRSPWFVGVKVDAAEILAPARNWSLALGAVVLLLVASGAGAVALWWRHQSALRERARYEEGRRYQAFTRHLELLSEHADDVVLLVGFDGRIVRANERVREQYGWSVQELVGQDLRVLRAPGHESRDQLERIREQGRGRYETVHRRRDGSTFPVDVSARRFDAQGQGYFQAIVRDATERKRVLAELSYQAEILQNVYDGVIGLDSDHVVRSWNAGAERMYGIPASEAIGRPISDLLPSDYQGYDSWREFVDGVNGGDRMQFQVRRKLRDGRELEVEGAAVVLRDASRRITGYVTINRDVTEQRRAREQLLHSQKMEAVGQLASGVAHDFNNLLVAILSCSEFLLESIEPSDPRHADVEEIRQAGQRAAHLVRQLLAFARKTPARPATVDLQGVVRGMEQLLRRTLGEHVELSSCVEPCLARIDPGHLEQVLMNLAVNARDAMDGGGRLHVEARTVVVERLPVGSDGLAPGRYAVLTVADTGCGIAPEVLPRIFEPFFTTKGAGQGTGLGLSTAYAIVRDAGGRISVDSQPGRGTRFSVYLPAGDAASSTEAPPPKAPARAVHGSTVLVVEDEELVRRVTTRTLRRGGYAVVEAATVDEAIRHLEGAAAVDLVLSDVVMPGRSGVELASVLESRWPDLPVVLMSGYSEWQQGLSGARHVLDKPFTAEGLLARVEEEIRSAGTVVRRAEAR